jgi:hypothetical protein
MCSEEGRVKTKTIVVYLNRADRIRTRHSARTFLGGQKVIKGTWQELLEVFVFDSNLVIETTHIKTSVPTSDNLRGDRTKLCLPRAERCGESGTMLRVQYRWFGIIGLEYGLRLRRQRG